MNFINQVVKEQFNNINLIFRIAKYDMKSKYEPHYLGRFWQFLSPLLQILIYWFVFGIGIRGGSPIDGYAFFPWLIVGLVPWFYISTTINQGSNSIFSKLNLVTKMQFPISVLPSITVISNAFSFFIMLVFVGGILAIYQINPGIYLLQLPYFLFAVLVFLFAATLLFSTLSTIIRDFHLLLQSVMRMFLYLTPILWNVDQLPEIFVQVLKLNPLFYLIDGFRNTLLGNGWFFNDIVYSIYFWVITLFILFIGSYLHIKFRKSFIDYL